jgi:hypothetical protein
VKLPSSKIGRTLAMFLVWYTYFHLYKIMVIIIFYNDTDAGAPNNLRATPLRVAGKILVSWTPPTPPTGSTITGYSIQYRIGSSGDYTTATDPGRGSTIPSVVYNLVGHTK